MRELGAAVLCLLYIKFRRSNKMEKYEAVVLVKHRAFVQLKTALQKMMPAAKRSLPSFSEFFPRSLQPKLLLI